MPKTQSTFVHVEEFVYAAEDGKPYRLRVTVDAYELARMYARRVLGNKSKRVVGCKGGVRIEATEVK